MGIPTEVISWCILVFGGLALVSAVVLPFISGPKSDLQIMRENSEYDRAQSRSNRG